MATAPETTATTELVIDTSVPPIETVIAVTPVREPVPSVTAVKSKPVAAPVLKTPEPTTFEGFVEKLKRDGNVQERAFITAIEKYIADMAPGLIVPKEVSARNQFVLYRTLTTAINNNEYAVFRVLWNLFLGYVHKYDTGVFNERYMFRDADAWSYGSEELDFYHRLLNLAKLTANPATREFGLRQVDMGRSLRSSFISEEGRSRLLEFYGK